MSRETQMIAGILLVVLTSVMFGGLSILALLTQHAPGFVDNPLRHDLWRAAMHTQAFISYCRS
jgi:hypothetical protein